MIVRPGRGHGPGSQIVSSRGSSQALNFSDAEAISKLDLLKNVAPESSKNYQVVSGGNNTNTTVTGTISSYTEIKNLEIKKGIFFSDQHNLRISKVTVLGPNVVADLFPGEENVIGKKVRINGVEFSVVGTTVAKGGGGFGSSDDIIYIPLFSFQQYLSGDEYLSMINIQAQDSQSMDEAQAQIEKIILARHKIKDIEDADFSVMNQADIIEAASTVTETLTLLLGAIAGISLVVGGIGIMNMMLTTVTERTREIGLRKAIGAKKNEINNQFLIESIAVTLIGGILGVILGWGISYFVSAMGILQAVVSWNSILLAFGVSAFIGIVFGYYPARKASKLNPIEALRYE
ncbi:MAG: multidrug ABC transporter substrate-binding protein [Candidatus Moranbacteria bacterium CG08_land_8_20_14_0_20_34_16]|nr:MAG: multidrug ABC transporter substrate-binding protein [Candidatus Moranbacteria bacterium CG08_land_8_20_14_0_20_34_16]